MVHHPRIASGGKVYAGKWYHYTWLRVVTVRGLVGVSVPPRYTAYCRLSSLANTVANCGILRYLGYRIERTRNETSNTTGTPACI